MTYSFTSSADYFRHFFAPCSPINLHKFSSRMTSAANKAFWKISTGWNTFHLQFALSAPTIHNVQAPNSFWHSGKVGMGNPNCNWIAAMPDMTRWNCGPLPDQVPQGIYCLLISDTANQLFSDSIGSNRLIPRYSIFFLSQCRLLHPRTDILKTIFSDVRNTSSV